MQYAAIALATCLALSACSDDATPPKSDATVADVTIAQEGGGDQEVNACLACAADELCVQSFDGNCLTGGPHCKKVSAACLASAAACTAACEPEICGSPWQCKTQIPCGTEDKNASVYCYGP